MAPIFIPAFIIVGALAFVGSMMWYFDAKGTRLSNLRKAQEAQLKQDEMDPTKYKILTNGKGKYKIQFPSGHCTAAEFDSLGYVDWCITTYVKMYQDEWDAEHQTWTEVTEK
jgi:hypothetical protein